MKKKSVKIKILVEFVISRAVSVLFFKLKATGMRPVLQSTAANHEDKKEDRIIPDNPNRCNNVMFFSSSFFFF